MLSCRGYASLSLEGWLGLLFGFRGFGILGRVTVAHHPTGKASDRHGGSPFALRFLVTWRIISAQFGVQNNESVG